MAIGLTFENLNVVPVERNIHNFNLKSLKVAVEVKILS